MDDDTNYILLSYIGKINIEAEEKYWQEIGYSTRMEKKSLKVINLQEEEIAIYGKNRIRIPRIRLDKFIEEMR